MVRVSLCNTLFFVPGTQTMVTSDDYDDNSIELEVILRLTIDNTVAPDTTTWTVRSVLTYNSASPATVTATATVTVTGDATDANANTVSRPGLEHLG